MNAGIYSITNTVNGKRYIGSTKNFVNRFRGHIYHLNRSTHHSQKLQRAWDKYGADAFKFEKLLVCAIEHLLMYEQIMIDGFNACKAGYNTLVKAGSRQDTPHDKKTVDKMRAFQRSYRKKYFWRDQMLCIAEIAEIEGLPRDTLWRRVVMDGMNLEDAVKMPYKKPGQPISGLGTSMTFYEWVDKIGCTVSFLRLWLRKGLSIDECITKYKTITVHEFGRLAGIETGAFSARINSGWSVGDALATPVKASMTMEQATEIRKLNGTMTRKEIAKKYNVHPDTIGLIIRNKTFKDSSQ